MVPINYSIAGAGQQELGEGGWGGGGQYVIYRSWSRVNRYEVMWMSGETHLVGLLHCEL